MRNFMGNPILGSEMKKNVSFLGASSISARIEHKTGFIVVFTICELVASNFLMFNVYFNVLIS
jgi:hypothetical protein